MADTAYLLRQAMAHHDAGRLADAETLYKQILAAEPEHADALHLSGLIAFQQGDGAAASARIEAAIAKNPNVALYHANLGRVRIALGRPADALAAYTRALELAPDEAPVLADRAAAKLALDDAEGAAADARRAIRFEPRLAEAHHNLGLALQELGDMGAAEASFRHAVALKPDLADAHQSLGQIAQAQGRLDEAVQHYRRAADARPGFVEAICNLGNVLRDLGRLDEAIVTYRHALAVAPESAEVHCNLGVARHEQGNLAAALASFDRALQLKPDDPETRRNRALTLLLAGRFGEGWDDYEWRWQAASFAPLRRDFKEPLWDGAPLLGARILVHAEQGLGDTIQFVRYLPMVAARGGRVVLECPAPLVEFLQRHRYAEAVVAAGAAYPPCDVRVPLLSLPRLFRTNRDNIPDTVPYLWAEQERVLAWRRRLGRDAGPDILRVGLAWAGDPKHRYDRHRSMPARLLAPFLASPGMRFFSLQVGPAAGQIADLPAGSVVDLAPEIKPFAEMTAVIAALDLVITVDTAVAHLAGALAVPTWVALAYVPDWRWQMGRDDSPWYPTLRLFRQPKPGDWESVIHAVAANLNPWGRG